MTHSIAEELSGTKGAGAALPVSTRGKQRTLFPIHPTDAWKLLSTDGLPLDKEKYETICRCYREIFDSFLPGRGRGSVPFYTQVSEQLKAEGLAIGPRALARLVSRAQKLGIDHFPDPRTRAVPSSSPKAMKLQSPVSSGRMSADEHNTFAEIYRSLLGTYRKKSKRGEGFFAQAAAKMQQRGYNYTEKQLALYAHFRRRIGDVNFPRVRGSQEIERMQIAAVERMRALGVMATGLMHEILQPLQVIQSTAEHQRKQIEAGVVAPEPIAERLERIIRQAKVINEVVQHVRTIARTGELRVGAVELHSAIERALTLFGEQLRSRGINTDLSGVAADLPPVSADPVALERVFINLITNARDAIEETNRKSGQIKFLVYEKGSSIVCEVSDNGIGIAEGNLERIFDAYFTTKAVGKGTGLGLTEVFNAMIQFGGRITAANNPSQGATFLLEFQKHAPAD
jgi:C4-dicarboxylate-specific signal transduction histidine kinase